MFGMGRTPAAIRNELWKRIRVHSVSEIETSRCWKFLHDKAEVYTIEDLADTSTTKIAEVFGQWREGKKIALETVNSYIDGDESWKDFDSAGLDYTERMELRDALKVILKQCNTNKFPGLDGIQMWRMSEYSRTALQSIREANKKK